MRNLRFVLALALALALPLRADAERHAKVTIIDGVSMAATITGTGQNIETLNAYAVQCGWTSTPVGTIQLQASNDNTTYIDVSTQAAGGAAGNVLFDVPTPGYRYVRILYTRTSSSGTLTCVLFGKGT